jgi:hypothetical protein
MLKNIPGLDYSYCQICQKWIIEPPEIQRLETQLKRLDTTKKQGKELLAQITKAKAQKVNHENHK